VTLYYLAKIIPGDPVRDPDEKVIDLLKDTRAVAEERA